MLVRAVGVACLIAALAALPSPAAADAAGGAQLHRFTGAEQRIVLEGRGAGHGVGLCQWGARGRALAGQSAEEIAGAYYAGTAVRQVSPPDAVVRVRIHEGLEPATDEASRITGWGGAWQVAPSGGADPVVVPAGGFLEVGRDADGARYTVRTEDGAVLASGPLGTLDAPLVLRPLEAGAGDVRFAVGYKAAREVPGRAGARYDVYRGELVLSPREKGLETINRVALEDYLRGVVPAEVPVAWPAEALRAQALVSRSFAAWRAGVRASERYDLTDTAADQAYLGANAEHPLTDAAVRSTAGLVVTHGERVAQTVFFAACGGWTEHNESVWPSGAPVAYLRGIRDADAAGRAYDADAPQSAWKTGAFSAAQLEAMLNAPSSGATGAGPGPGPGAGEGRGLDVGRLVGLDLSERSASGRLLSVKLIGTLGTKAMRPDDFVARFNAARPAGVGPLYSTAFGVAAFGVASAEAGAGGGGEPQAGTATRPQAATAGGGRVHTVQRGETLYGIARSSGTTVAALVAANGLASAEAIIRVGQRLIIP